MGRTLVANRLLAGSACGKRQRVRPLNSVVRQQEHMDAASKSDLSLAFWFLLLVLNLAVGAFFYLSKNGALKRRIYPFVLVGSALFFLGFVFAESGFPSGAVPYGFIAVIALILLLNFRAMKFCDSCGKVVRSFLGGANYCPKCGAQLK